MGSAVDPENLSRELRRYQEAGLGGVHIIPIYGAKGYESRYIRYLTPEWMRMLRHSVEEAARLDLGVDMTTGTGWCFGGPNISEREACATVVVRKHSLRAGGRLSEVFDRGSLQALAAFSPGRPAVELTDRIGADGRLDWTPDSGEWVVYAVSQQPCKVKVKRAAPGGEGHMLNPFYREAITRYLDWFERAFAAYEGPKPRAMYHDSFEYGANWSPDLFAEFERRRGYRLQEELPALFGEGTDERTARVKSDYRETLSDLMVEHFMPAWTAWCKRHGFLTRNQAHGSPGNLLDLYAAADIPETEMFHLDRNILISKLASSAAHVMGKRWVASETGTWLKEHFQETLGELKKLVDELFLAGVNHIIYHGTCYSPDDAPWPGWVFYASTQMNPRNPIWRDAPALNAYISRAQSVLQASRADHDILLYWPIYDLWHEPKGLNINMTVHRREWFEKQAVGAAAERLWRRGFTFDFVSDRGLKGVRATARGLETAGGAYRVVLVPACRYMPADTLETLLSLVRQGATVIFENDLPGDVPGLARLEQRRQSMRRMLAEVRPAPAGRGDLRRARLGKGQFVIGDAEAALEWAGVRREVLVDRAGLHFLRRTFPEGRSYFLVNRGSERVEGWTPLAMRARAAVLMDPMSGKIGVAALRAGSGGDSEVYLQLEPGQSVIVRLWRDRQVRGPRWEYWRITGSAHAIEGTWHVRPLAGGPQMPGAYSTRVLSSWTEQGGEWQRFGGTAVFEIRFDAPTAAAEAWLLDLGRVHESARVRLNGRELQTLILPPYQVQVAGLQPRGNVLEVEVTNLAANRIRDMDRRKVAWRIFHDINFVNIQYRPFDASEWPLRDSGLLGPVVLRALTRVPLSAR